MNALSTISITAIDSVSAASATAIAARNATPARSTGAHRERVAEQERQRDRQDHGRPRGQPSAVPMTMPSTSPIAQPVRQCSVALDSGSPSVRSWLRTIYPLGVSRNSLTWSSVQHLRFGHPASEAKSACMRYRTLGGTGIEVSVHCLGTMMFGAVGNPDHDDCVRIIHAALDAGHQLRGHGRHVLRRASPRRSSARRWRVAGTTSCWPPRCTSRWARARTGAATRGAGSSSAVEESLRRLRHRLDRPVPGAPARTTRPTSRRRCRRSPTWCGQGRSARSAVRPSRPRRSSRPTTWRERRGLHRFRTEQPPYSILARGIEASRAADVRSGSGWAC